MVFLFAIVQGSSKTSSSSSIALCTIPQPCFQIQCCEKRERGINAAILNVLNCLVQDKKTWTCYSGQVSVL